MSDERITKEDELNGIELWNMALFSPHWWKPWLTFFYIDCPQYLSFNLFDKYDIQPFFFRFSEHKDGKYIGVKCCIKKSRIDDFLVCMHEMQRNMTICGYSDYEEFCRKWQEDLKEEDDANE